MPPQLHSGGVLVEADGAHLAGGVTVGGAGAAVDLLHQGGQLDGHPDVAGEIDGQAEVLGDQTHREALVVVSALEHRADVALEEHRAGRRADERGVSLPRSTPARTPTASASAVATDWTNHMRLSRS